MTNRCEYKQKGCGGCPLLGKAYAEQLAQKQRRVEKLLGKFGPVEPILGMETASWVCVFGAAPFAVLGFVSYHKMPAEKFILEWFKSEVLEPHYLPFHPNNLYYEAMKDEIAKKEKEAMKKHESRKKSTEN